MSFGLYSLGFAIVIGGLIYAAYLLHMPAHWIAVGAVVLLGLGILTGVKATRQKDPVGCALSLRYDFLPSLAPARDGLSRRNTRTSKKTMHGTTTMPATIRKYPRSPAISPATSFRINSIPKV